MKSPKVVYYKVPFLFPVLGLIAGGIARMMGWKVIGDMKNYDKCVLIGAPHTSNWDYMMFLWAISVSKLHIHVLAKKSLFRFPLGYFIRFFGGVPVDRAKRSSAVEQGVAFLKAADSKTILLVAPEGTRAYNKEWKSGFYHMAWEAKVPLILAILDHKRKTVTIGTEFKMTGDYDKDIIDIKKLYAGATGFNAQNQDI